MNYTHALAPGVKRQLVTPWIIAAIHARVIAPLACSHKQGRFRRITDHTPAFLAGLRRNHPGVVAQRGHLYQRLEEYMVRFTQRQPIRSELTRRFITHAAHIEQLSVGPKMPY